MRAFSLLRGILSRRSAVSPAFPAVPSSHPVARAAAYAVDLLEQRTLLSSIGGIVWQDDNADGYHDAVEGGVSGIQVYDDLNGDGSPAGDPSAYTDEAGHYEITDLDSQACHLIRMVVPGGWTQTSGGGSISISDPNGYAGYADMGLAPAGVVSGQVINDENQNGQADPGESAIGGFTLHADRNNNGMVDPGEQTVATNSDGTFTLNNLTLGTNQLLRILGQQGWNTGSTTFSLDSSNPTASGISVFVSSTTTTTGTISGGQLNGQLNGTRSIFDVCPVSARLFSCRVELAMPLGGSVYHVLNAQSG